MSEYQYYEFQAIDRPLDDRARAALRAITSRAEITATSLINEYHWGDFKGDPDKLMDKYFDAHLYLANWGTHRLMLRLPVRGFPLATARPYTVPYVFTARATKEHVVLDFHSEAEGDWEYTEGEGWLASLIPLRGDLLAGDLRCLYLGWLAGVQTEEVAEDTPEPPVPPGLKRLSAPLTRFAEFLRIDSELIEVAAAGSVGEPPSGPRADELEEWLGQIPPKDKDAYLVRLMSGEGVPLTGELLRRFREERVRKQVAAGGTRQPKPTPRTAGQLRAAWHRLAEENRRREAERAAKEKVRRDRERAAARERHLDSLTGREEELWSEAEGAMQSRAQKEYDHAVKLLVDLRDLAERSGSTEAVARRMRELRDRHRGKRTLIERLDRAGLP